MDEKNTSRNERPGAIVLAINICDTIIRDQMTNKVSLIGLFSTIWAPSFPCRHPKMHIYIALTGGHGKYTMEVKLVKAADGSPVMGMEGPVAFQNPLQVAEVNLEWRNVEFKEPGEYVVEVLCDGNPVGRRKFGVQQTGGSPPTEGSEVT